MTDMGRYDHYTDSYIQEPKTDGDCISRQEAIRLFEQRFIELQKAHQQDKQLGVNWCINTIKDIPPVTPTKCIATIQFSKEDLKKICEEQIEVATKQEQYYKDLAKSYEKTINKLTKAIAEQEPKTDGDCISRKKTCDYIAEFINHEYSTQAECEMVDTMIEGIQHLPSVQPKTGHWIYDDDCHEHGHCSECGTKEDLVDGKIRYFCRVCGARMSEVSEDGSN